MRLSSFLLLAVRDALSRSWWVKSLVWSGKEAGSIAYKNLLDWLRLGGLLMTSRSGGLKPRAVAGKPSVTKLTLSIFDTKTSNRIVYAASLESDSIESLSSAKSPKAAALEPNPQEFQGPLWRRWMPLHLERQLSSAIIGYHRHKCYQLRIYWFYWDDLADTSAVWAPHQYSRIWDIGWTPATTNHRTTSLTLTTIWFSISFHGLEAQAV